MSAEACPICGGGVMVRGGITIFQCGAGHCQHAAEVVERLRVENANLLHSLKWSILQLKGPSGMEWLNWQDHPEYQKAKKAIASAEAKP